MRSRTGGGPTGGGKAQVDPAVRVNPCSSERFERSRPVVEVDPTMFEWQRSVDHEFEKSPVLNSVYRDGMTLHPADYEQASAKGMVLLALQGPNGDPACDIVHRSGRSFRSSLPSLRIRSVPARPEARKAVRQAVRRSTSITTRGKRARRESIVPGGFQNAVGESSCARSSDSVPHRSVSSGPPAANTRIPALERRDLAIGRQLDPTRRQHRESAGPVLAG